MWSLWHLSTLATSQLLTRRLRECFLVAGTLSDEMWHHLRCVVSSCISLLSNNHPQVVIYLAYLTTLLLLVVKWLLRRISRNELWICINAHIKSMLRCNFWVLNLWNFFCRGVVALDIIVILHTSLHQFSRIKDSS